MGTATPKSNELSEVKHHFIQSHTITDNYNASRFETEALLLIEQLFEKNNLLFLAGGSMLYIDAVCKGIDEMPDADQEIRLNLKLKLENEGIEGLRLQLKQLDPDYYQIVDLKNPNRIIHALEICLTTGKPFSSFRTNPKKIRPFIIIKIGLDCDRQILHNQINTRVDKMIEEGLEMESQKLYANRNLNALNTVGYREFFDYFDGKISRETAIELIKRNTRRYARKQLTWFRNDQQIVWFQPENITEIIEFIEQKAGFNNE
ncbi:MAG TPA: tRNA (adenosine(37)-N6)-dimethylallyltransferase MiaA [Flavobacterium sp.]|nr:tRNA (adenosine(37)-N6)-dimethylallyltransferase MiaA [Flavobacterium sp.]